jgi:thiopeptide-type bacteriocin biosynthesis protein
MSTDKTEHWFSCYLYYAGSADSFLINQVLPLLQKVLAAKQVSEFFFILYDDTHGPHIRLRLKCSNAAEAPLRTVIKATFSPIRFVRYTPEIRRYGGQQGIAVAERLFVASSQTTLDCMRHAVGWNYSQAVGWALQLHVAMAVGFGIDKQETSAFFEHVAQIYHKDRLAVIKQLEAHLHSQRDRLVPHLRKLWNRCEADQLKQIWLSQWLQEVKAARHQLQALSRENRLNIPYSPSHELNQLWYLYESYVHLTNNRLGLAKEDELFVAYILQETLKHDA